MSDPAEASRAERTRLVEIDAALEDAQCTLITTKQAAELWGITSVTFRAYVTRETAPRPVAYHGRVAMYDRAQVVAALRRRPGQAARTDLDRHEREK